MLALEEDRVFKNLKANRTLQYLAEILVAAV
jgi:hypothetical protein